jgi:hypothetical protein
MPDTPNTDAAAPGLDALSIVSRRFSPGCPMQDFEPAQHGAVVVNLPILQQFAALSSVLLLPEDLPLLVIGDGRLDTL